ncbi:MAG: T9SS type A sorting domain-containing protein [Bacteroidetes bacterium]|nr:T9SS type A sorting domain-containing protein [Bacteroidota bacterium]
MMKKAKQCIPILAMVVLTTLVQSGLCQNTFPSTGSVGIGTTTPSSMLTIRPTGANAFEIRPSSSTTSVTGEIRMLELAANGTNYVGFKAPSLISTNQIWVLPSTAGSSGQVLARTTGSDLVWSTVPATSLNNLTTTSINVDLIPSTSAVRNLGSSTLRWNLGYFNSGVVIGNTTLTTAGMIRYSSGAFEGYNGSAWLNLSGANNSLSNLSTTAINANLIPSGTRTLGNSSNPWSEIWSNKVLSGTVNVAVWNATTQNFAAGGGRISTGTTINNNIHIGLNAGGLNSPSEFDNFDNVIVGTSSGSSITSGFFNVLMGSSAGGSITSGGGNTLIGHQCGITLGTGFDNTLIGNVANVSSGDLSNATAIGRSALVDANNKVRIGNSSIASNGGQVSWTAFSDARIKNSIQENVPGLTFINALRPVTYHFDITKQNQLMGITDTANWQGKYDIEKIQFTGFIAQEVEAAAKKIGYDFSGVDKTGNLLGLRYSEFVMPLVKSVQELSAENNELKNEIASLKNHMQQVEQSLAQCCTAYQPSNVHGTSSIDVPSLEQNAPNPFSEHTIIRYYMPLQAQSASIKIYALDGSELLSIPATTKGVGSVTVNGHSLASGVYVYTLIIDGKTIDTKQMILTKQ